MSRQVAMERDPLVDDLDIKHCNVHQLSMAMFD